MARKIAGLTLLMIGASLHCVAGLVIAPEIDPAAGGAALALLAGGLLIIRGRRTK
jgi:hypothetical protein